MAIFKYTIVQHSGGYFGSEFEFAVEPTPVTRAAEVQLVKKNGGLLFDSYVEAENFAEEANYPPGHDGGLIPEVTGTFSEDCIDDLKIYIPKDTR